MHPTRGFGVSRSRSKWTTPITGLPPASARSARAARSSSLSSPDLGLRLRRSDLVFDQRLLPRILDRFHRRQQS